MHAPILILTQESDIAIGPFHFQAQRRFIAADPSFVYSDEGGVLLSGFDFAGGVAKGSSNLNGIAVLAQPFDVTAWFCLFLVMSLFSGVYTSAELLIELKRNLKNKERIVLNILDNLASLFAALAGERISKLSKLPKKALSKQIKVPFSRTNPFSKFDYIVLLNSKSRVTQEILNWFWTSAVLTIPVYYSSFIFAKIVSQPVFVVESFDDIAKLPEIEIAFWKGTSFCYNAIYPNLESDSFDLFDQIRLNEKRILDLPRNELISVVSLDAVLEGKRIIYGAFTMMPQALSERFSKSERKCGFFQSKPHYTLMVSMLFNKNLNLGIKKAVNKKYNNTTS